MEPNIKITNQQNVSSNSSQYQNTGGSLSDLSKIFGGGLIQTPIKREIQKLIDLSTRRTYVKRIGDTPTDALQLIPKKFLGQVFSTATRPASITGTLSVMIFNSTDGMPWFFNPNSSVWVTAAGSVVASN